MSVIQSPVLDGGGGSSAFSGKSLRLRNSASAGLSRTFTTAGTSAWTYSAWMKRTIIGTGKFPIFCSSTINNGNVSFYNDIIQIRKTSVGVNSTAVYRDTSAFGHVVINSTGSSVKVYWNNVLVHSYAGVLGGYGGYNAAVAHYIGRTDTGSAEAGYFDGYIAEVTFVDGQTLNPDAFAEYDSVTGQWVPKTYTGTYGNNGFYLDFKDGTSLTTLGYDKSGNNNHWTLNNVSITAGKTYDWMNDYPTNNYCTLNLLKQYTAQTLTQGALNYYTPTDSTILGTQGVSSGKWYWEVLVVTNSGTQASIGVSTDVFNPPTNDFDMAPYGYSYLGSANKRNNGVLTAYGATYTNNDVIGVALDMDTRALVFYKNDVSQGTAYTVTAGTYFPALGNGNHANAKEYAINFGQRPFQYTPPTGFKSLCTQNLPEPSVKNSATAYKSVIATGATIKATAQGIFTNEIAWMRDTVAAANGQIADSARGINVIIQPNTTSIGTTFTTPANATLGMVWDIGTSASNTTGTISATNWTNVSSGVSVVTYTGTGVAGTIGHGLGKAPSFILVKNISDALDWTVYHVTQGNTKKIIMNSSAGFVTSTNWSNTTPTVNVFSVSAETVVNTLNKNYIAYCFAEVEGFSKFGVYTGNSSSDGPFINLGFRPSFWMHKSIDETGNWYIYNGAWEPENDLTNIYYPNSTSLAVGNAIDMVSNGIKIRANASGLNTSGTQYVYAAFAEAPFKYALAR